MCEARESVPADEPAERRFPSFRASLFTLAGQHLPRTALAHTTHFGDVGDIIFVDAGTVMDAITGEEEESAEFFWGLQLTREFEAAKLAQPRSQLKGFYLNGDGGGRWTLLTTDIATVFCENLLIDPSTKEPFLVHSEQLPSGWTDQATTVYNLPETLVEALEVAVEARVRLAMVAAQSEGTGSHLNPSPALLEAETRDEGSSSNNSTEREARRAARALEREALFAGIGHGESPVRSRARPQRAAAGRPRVS